jgi:CheY-like chemotaxis protein
MRFIATESEFRDSLDRIADDPPALVIMDVMLRWCDPSPEMPPQPDDVRAAGFSRAGVRCSQLLRANSMTRGIPVVVFTVLDANGLSLPPDCTFISKASDLRPFLDAVGERLSRARTQESPS